MWIKIQRHGLKQILTNVLIGHFRKGKMGNKNVKSTKQLSVSVAKVLTCQ